MSVISSAQNGLIKRIRRLKQRKYRLRESRFFIEGLRLVLSAIEHDAVVEQLVVAPGMLSSEIGQRMVELQRASGTPVSEISDELFRSISERDRPVGIGAIVGLQWLSLDDLPLHKDAVYVLLERIADPGNLGTILRSLDAVGGAGLILSGATTDPMHPAASKASMGTMFSIPIARVDSTNVALSWAAKQRIMTVATSAHGAETHWDAELQRPLLLLMGSEREGLSSVALEQATRQVRIPMNGTATSLNVGTATTVLLYEIMRKHSMQ